MRASYFARSDVLLGQRGGREIKTIGEASWPYSARPRAAFV
jgi:hypothetical protein